jgi:cytochrome c oxidase subunit 4
MSTHNEHSEHAVHIVPIPVYLGVFFALVIGTIVTWQVSLIDLGRWNAVVALTIAVCKATLVVLFFMHVKYSSKLTKLTVFSGLFTFIVLIGMTLSDYFTRAWGRW